MAFQSEHELAIDGSAGDDTWPALDVALAHRTDNTAGYSYVSPGVS